MYYYDIKTEHYTVQMYYEYAFYPQEIIKAPSPLQKLFVNVKSPVLYNTAGLKISAATPRHKY